MQFKPMILKSSWQADILMLFILTPILLLSVFLAWFFLSEHLPLAFWFFVFLSCLGLVGIMAMAIRIFTDAGNIAIESEGVRRFYGFGRTNFMPWSDIDSFGVWPLQAFDRVVFKKTANDVDRIFTDALYPISTADLVSLLQRCLHNYRQNVPLLDDTLLQERSWWRSSKTVLILLSGSFIWLIILNIISMTFFQTAELTLRNDSGYVVKNLLFQARTQERMLQFSAPEILPHDVRPEVLKGFMHGPITINYAMSDIPTCAVVNKQYCPWAGDTLIFSNDGLIRLVPPNNHCKPGKISITQCP